MDWIVTKRDTWVLLIQNAVHPEFAREIQISTKPNTTYLAESDWPTKPEIFLFSVDCFYDCKITLYCFKLTIEFERNIINKVKVNNNKCLQSFLITIFSLILCKEKLKTYKYFKHFRLHWIDLSVTLSINILKIWKNQIDILRQM